MAETLDKTAVAETTDTAVEARERKEERAHEMRSAGFTYRQIADTLHVSLGTAHAYVKREMARRRQELAESREDVRDLDMAKLAWVERRLIQLAIEGDLKATRLLHNSIQIRRQYMKDLPVEKTMNDSLKELETFMSRPDVPWMLDIE
ncbi:MAG: hypothetical protein MI757_22175 [Pirellulales bacterium]|nr:hypothetical protein [Pirellulales bacterium]